MKNKQFEKNGFIVIRKIIDPAPWYKHTRQLYKKSFHSDKQIPGTPSFYKEKKMEELHKNIHTLLEKKLGLELYRTYSYLRLYKKGDILRAHKDRPACEISLTLTLGYDSDSIWPIYIMNKDEKPVKVNLQPGDALLYKGCEHLHWRSKFHGKNQSQVFLHYVDKKGPNAIWKDDRKID